MDKKYICYCGLYCLNCAVKAKVEPAAKVLFEEMKNAGFEEVIQMIPGGEGFWPFLKDMAEKGMCISCCEGGGNPQCAIRICAKEKGVEICALCESYPCETFEKYAEYFTESYPIMKQDNDFLREKGFEQWCKMQDERREKGFIYADTKGDCE